MVAAMEENISTLRYTARLAKIDFQQAKQFLLHAELSAKQVQVQRNCPKARRAAVRIAKAIALVRLAERNIGSILR